MTRQTVAILPEGQFERKDTTFNFPTVSQPVQTSLSQQDSRGTFSTRRVPVIKRAAVFCSRSRRSALIVPYRRKDGNRRLRVEIAIRAIASELTIASQSHLRAKMAIHGSASELNRIKIKTCE